MGSRNDEWLLHDLAIIATVDGPPTSESLQILDRIRQAADVDPEVLGRLIKDSVAKVGRDFILPADQGLKLRVVELAIDIAASDKHLSEGEIELLDRLAERVGLRHEDMRKSLALRFPDVALRLQGRPAVSGRRWVPVAAIVAVLLAAGAYVGARALDPYNRALGAMKAGGPLDPAQVDLLASRTAETLREIRTGLAQPGARTEGYQAVIGPLLQRAPSAELVATARLLPAPAQDACLGPLVGAGRWELLAPLVKEDAAAVERILRAEGPAVLRRSATDPPLLDLVAALGGSSSRLIRDLADIGIRKGDFAAILPLSDRFAGPVRAALMGRAGEVCDALTPQNRPAAMELLGRYPEAPEIGEGILDRAEQPAALRLPRIDLLELAMVTGAAVEPRIRRWPSSRLVALFPESEVAVAEGTVAPWRASLARRHEVARAMALLRQGRGIEPLPESLAAALRQEGDFAAAELDAIARGDADRAFAIAAFATRSLRASDARDLVQGILGGMKASESTRFLDELLPGPPAWLLSDLLARSPREVRPWIAKNWEEILISARNLGSAGEIADTLDCLSKVEPPLKLASWILARSATVASVPLLDWARVKANPEFERFMTARTEAWFTGQDDATLKGLSTLCGMLPDIARRIDSLIEQRAVKREIEELIAMGGRFSELPKGKKRAPEIRKGVSLYQIDNETGHELTVWFSGADSCKVVVSDGDRKEVELRSGSFTIYASVDAPNVNPFRTQMGIEGTYHILFYLSGGNDPGGPPPSYCSGDHTRTRKVYDR